MQEQQQGVAGKNGGRLSMAGIGRPRGVPNKITRTLKALVTGALHAVGGQKYLERAARSPHVSERIAFLSLCGRVAPLEIRGELDAALTVVVNTYAAAPNGEPIPTQGTCVIEGTAQRAPLLAPIRAKSDDAEVIER